MRFLAIYVIDIIIFVAGFSGGLWCGWNLAKADKLFDLQSNEWDKEEYGS